MKTTKMIGVALSLSMALATACGVTDEDSGRATSAASQCVDECAAWGATCNAEGALETCFVDENGCRKRVVQTCATGCTAGACNACDSITSPRLSQTTVEDGGFYDDLVVDDTVALASYRPKVGVTLRVASLDLARPEAIAGTRAIDAPLVRLRLAKGRLFGLNQSRLDIYDAKSAELLGEWAAENAGTRAYDLSVDGDLACVAADTGLELVDASSPAHPVLAGSLVTSFAPQRVVCRDGYAVIAGTDLVQVVDVHTPSNPFLVAEGAASDLTAYARGSVLAFDGRAIYTLVDVGSWETRTQRIDIYDLAPPSRALKKVGSFPWRGDIQTMRVDAGKLLFGTTYSVGLVDVSDLAHPRLVKHTPVPGGASAFGLRKGVVYAAGTAVNALDLAKAPDVDVLGTPAKDSLRDGVQLGSLAYTARSSGLVIEDVRDPLHPVVLSQTGKEATGVALRGSLAFVTSNANGTELLVYDVSRPKQPVLVGRAAARPQYSSGNDTVDHLRVSGDRAYAICSQYLCTFDISVTTAPRQLGSTLINGFGVRDFEVAGDAVYVSATTPSYSDSAFEAFDLRDANAPVKMGSAVLHDRSVGAIAVSGDTAYVAGGCLGVYGDWCVTTLDISDRMNPREIAKLQQEDFLLPPKTNPIAVSSLRADGRWLFASHAGGVVVVDVADRNAPRVVTEVWTLAPTGPLFLSSTAMRAWGWSSSYPDAKGSDQLLALCK